MFPLYPVPGQNGLGPALYVYADVPEDEIRYLNKKMEDNICLINMFPNNKEIYIGWTDIDFAQNKKIIDDLIKDGIKEEDITAEMVLDTWHRFHFGKDMLECYMCNEIKLLPLLDPELIKLKLYSKDCTDRNLLMAIIMRKQLLLHWK